MTSRVAPRWWNLSALGTTVPLALLALGPQPRIPGLSLVDLGFASLGHLAGEAAGVLGAASVLPAIGGLVLSVAVPLLRPRRFGRTERLDRAARSAGPGGPRPCRRRGRRVADGRPGPLRGGRGGVRGAPRGRRGAGGAPCGLAGAAADARTTAPDLARRCRAPHGGEATPALEGHRPHVRVEDLEAHVVGAGGPVLRHPAGHRVLVAPRHDGVHQPVAARWR